ncbi:GNAT family N-acetyltransferase [Falsiroseomonas oryzae]|uniref:GNAT family N-acetyltransferase n=1 Tax=Falsiroseomonas oryzae TaxID=2766473 RepID=UPI0022EA6D55|nr:GNAT family N-acetyltransferase [Roseomonas sp. MO-31]
MTRLVRPAAEHLAEYADALRRGFEPSTFSGPALAWAQLEAIAHDPAAFLAGLDDPVGGQVVVLPGGRTVRRLPGFSRWILDGGFCGVIHFRWQPGVPELPDYVLGHVGYEVVPWRRGEGQATRALGLLLAEVAPLGLPWVEVVTGAANPASIRVIEAQGGRLVERFTAGPAQGGAAMLRFRIPLAAPSPA